MKKTFAKLRSVKFWITMFCCALLTYIIVANRTDFKDIAEKLTLVPLIYLPVNLGQKYVLRNGQDKENNNDG